ncbi:efflux RND transporter permease subunit [Litoribrevibacter albus]|uniref:Acriflavin resistance protein n=1 Tax=Litoribrevibacter albus TaxID=1473156 RepID=A0AA37S7V9_9GAMM|nr:efflux RND transporter permease subunit [Litoribrevibacter albus]GLQ29897.1 acriflavin resistance protein [Litoribrevibacter albus]
MAKLIEFALQKNRSVFVIFLFLIISGIVALNSMPKESEPDVAVPYIYVSMIYDGISPEDAERLLVRPMESELKSIEGVKEMTALASEGHASVTLEFDAGFDSKTALQDVREKVDLAKVELPDGAEEPEVHEINVALFPVMTIGLSGPVPERQMLMIARDLRDDIEALAGVLEVEIGGEREEMLEVIVDPVILETYNVNLEEVFNIVGRNNQLVAAGALDTGSGRMVMKVPGVIEEPMDLLELPVKVHDGRVVKIGDVAEVRRTFKDPEGFARVNGQPALALEVKKRIGANIIGTLDEIRALIKTKQEFWPADVEVAYILDKSEEIEEMLTDLFNNVLSAIVLVMIVIIAAMGFRSSVIVGMMIPGSFLAALLIIDAIGFTLNIVVLFSLILVVGMLVDGAIVVAELADRKLKEGESPKAAYAAAATRMAWPVIASTATTLAVFIPLLPWPGVMGEFMKFLPATVIICLIAATLMALVFLPVIGAAITRKKQQGSLDQEVSASLITRGYGRLLGVLLKMPAKFFLLVMILVVTAYASYFKFGKGAEFFPDVEPDSAQILVRARGDLSIYEKDALLKKVEERVVGMPELLSVYARSFNRAANEMPDDTIGALQFRFIDWQDRPKASAILEEMKQRTQDIAGVVLEYRKQNDGPSGGKPIQLQVSGWYNESITEAVDRIVSVLGSMDGIKDLEDNRPLPGIDWKLNLDRELAAQNGADVTLTGSAVQLVTTGIRVAGYRPDDSDEELDIRVRYPEEARNLEQFEQIRLRTDRGMVALGNFLTLEPDPKVGNLTRVDSRRAITIQADVQEGVLVADKLKELQSQLEGVTFPADIRIKFKGEDEDAKETGEFLSQAFGTAIILMLLILVTQFNSFYQSILVLSAIVLSSAGVVLGLLVTNQPFGIVMCGLGIIALAGIVVNNNIVLIDTYNQYRAAGYSAYDSALQTGMLRLRPVFLTAFTTVLGLIPMVMSMNIDLINRYVAFGAPSTQWWTQLSSSIAGGLSFATLLTLLLTPCLLVLGDNVSSWFKGLRRNSRLVKNRPLEVSVNVQSKPRREVV